MYLQRLTLHITSLLVYIRGCPPAEAIIKSFVMPKLNHSKSARIAHATLTRPLDFAAAFIPHKLEVANISTAVLLPHFLHSGHYDADRVAAADRIAGACNKVFRLTQAPRKARSVMQGTFWTYFLAPPTMPHDCHSRTLPCSRSRLV